MKQITILGATGSIGNSMLDVVALHPDKYQVFALTANNNVEDLLLQCRKFSPRYAVLADEQAALRFAQAQQAFGGETELLVGEAGLITVSKHATVDIVMAAIVGGAGLKPTLAAAKAGKRVLLANKEALVMSGQLFMAAVAANGAELLPVDSEHNAIFQCLPAKGEVRTGEIRRVLLTGSGGPFLERPLNDFAAISPEQACAHPNWCMGQKISVDSATMMNKGLEFIEACYLFDLPATQIEIVIHPQSVVHSMVEYIDGSIIAQLGQPDMKTPIAHALAWPERINSGVRSLDFFNLAALEFQAPDHDRFPCLQLAQDAFASQGCAPAVLNAANEVAVAAFLGKKIPFNGIPRVIESVLSRYNAAKADSIDAILNADEEARRCAEQLIARGQI